MAARARQGDVEDSHLRERKVAPSGSHRRRMDDHFQFCASRTTRHGGFGSASEYTKDDDKPVEV